MGTKFIGECSKEKYCVRGMEDAGPGRRRSWAAIQ